MIIKLYYKDTESDWIKHTGKKHKLLTKNPPDKVEIYIRDFYRNSPDKDGTVIVSFKVFHVMAREFFLEQKAEEKRDERHIDNTTDIQELLNGNYLDELLIIKERTAQLYSAINKLTYIQARRIILHYFNGWTLEKIASFEKVTKQAISESIYVSLKKLINILE